MALPHWKIGRALGIPIYVHASWFVVFFLVSSSLATGYLPEMLPGLSVPRYWGMGGIAALLLFLSVLLHELGHSYVALRYKIPIKQITLFIFGGMAHMGKEPPSPRAEFLIAMAGPLVSFILGAVCLSGAMAVDALPMRSTLQGHVVLGSLLGMVNVQLGLFNLIPGLPLDGGRVLRAGLWALNKDFHQATSQASLAGIGFGVVLGLIGAALMVGTWSGAVGQSSETNGGWRAYHRRRDRRSVVVAVARESRAAGRAARRSGASAAMNKVELLAHMRSGRAQFENALAQFSDDQLLAPKLHGGWSVKDLIAHIGFWEQHTAMRFSTLLRGMKPPEEFLTIDELNAQVYAQNRHKSLAEVRLAEQAAYEQLLLLVNNTLDDALLNPKRFAWTEGKPFAEWIEANTYGHYDEHLADFVPLS